jgi:hypothetical protein
VAVLACWRAGMAVRCVAGRRLECRDHGRAGDRGGSRGRARARDAVIKDQCMIMEPRAGDRLAAPRAAGAPRSRLHSSNGPPPRSPPRPAGASAADAAGSPGPVVPPGLGGAGLQRRRAVVVAARAWVTSTLVSCCCPGSYNKASSLYLAARGTAETAHRCCDPGPGRPGAGPGRQSAYQPVRVPASPRTSQSAYQPVRVPASPRTSPPDTACGPDPDPACTSTPARGRRVLPNPPRGRRGSPNPLSLRWAS